jgi:hypothetical protein
MLKKTILLALSVAALSALAAPAVGQAAELKENGVKLAKGALVTATSTNLETTVSGGAKLFCQKVTIHGEVTNVGGPGKKVEISNNSTTTEKCEITGFGAVLITKPTVGAITFTGGTGSATATFIADIPQECHLSGTVGFTYVNGSSTFSLPGSVLKGPVPLPEGCPKEGTIAGSFTLETSNGTAVVIEG